MGNKFNKAVSTTSSTKRSGKKNTLIIPTISSNMMTINTNTNTRMITLIEDKCQNSKLNDEHTIEEGFTEITDFDITPQTPPTPTLLFPHYESTSNYHQNTLTLSNSNNTLSDYEDSIQDSNLFHNSIIYLKNSYTNQQYL